MNSSDYHLCRTCEGLLWLKGGERLVKLLTILVPFILLSQVGLLYVLEALGMVIESGPKAGGPVPATIPLQFAILFLAAHFAGCRSEKIMLVNKEELDQ
jgi:hypothetical protein